MLFACSQILADIQAFVMLQADKAKAHGFSPTCLDAKFNSAD
jgi:hypothetical protein